MLGRTKNNRWGMGALLVAVALLLLAAGVAATGILASGGGGPAAADSPHAGLDFSIGIDTKGDTTDDCSTTGAITDKCTGFTGGKLTVRVYLNALGGIPSYDGYEAKLTYAGVVSKDSADPTVWPDCALKATSFQTGEVRLGCAIGIAAPSSTYTGMMGTAQFNCAEGTITMVHGTSPPTTDVVDSDLVSHAEGEGTSETLTINCGDVTPPPPTPPSSQINITNLGQYALPEACFDVENALDLTPLFTVCDNNFQPGLAPSAVCNADGTPECEDADPALGSVRVTVGAGSYIVSESKAPPEHSPPLAAQTCDAAGGSKCELTFVNTPSTRPHHPWDLVGDPITGGPDGLVRVADILEVIAHYFDDKPLE